MSHSSWKNVVTKSMLFWLNVIQKRFYCELVTNVVYDNFQDIHVPQGAIQCSREYKKFLKIISIHFNWSSMQLHHGHSLFLHNHIILWLCAMWAFQAKSQIWSILRNYSSLKHWPTFTDLKPQEWFCIPCSLSDQNYFCWKSFTIQFTLLCFFPAHIPNSPSCPRDSICVIYHPRTTCSSTFHAWDEPLQMPTLWISLALMTCVGVSTHLREWLNVTTCFQDGRCQLVRNTPSQCRQSTVVGI